MRHLPDVAALGEANSDPGIESMFGVYAPGKTPPETVARLNAEFVKATHGTYKLGIFTPTSLEVEKKPGPPPGDFKDLKLNGTQISLLDGGCGCPAQTVVVAAILYRVMGSARPRPS